MSASMGTSSCAKMPVETSILLFDVSGLQIQKNRIRWILPYSIWSAIENPNFDYSLVCEILIPHSGECSVSDAEHRVLCCLVCDAT